MRWTTAPGRTPDRRARYSIAVEVGTSEIAIDPAVVAREAQRDAYADRESRLVSRQRDRCPSLLPWLHGLAGFGTRPPRSRLDMPALADTGTSIVCFRDVGVSRPLTAYPGNDISPR